MRVIALATRLVSDDNAAAVRSIATDRHALEQGLSFAGFALFSSPLRPDSTRVIHKLRAARLATIMLTGDAALTACHVSAETGIVNKPLLLLRATGGGGYEWADPTRASVPPTPFVGNDAALSGLAAQFDLCVTGDGVAHAGSCGALSSLVRVAKVYARCAPYQKEQVITALRAAGACVLMCGDGTNDVGALKAASVGVALVGGDSRTGRAQRRGKKQQRDTWQDGMATPVARLGDASMAAPFTAKVPSVAACVAVIRHGRAAICTALQMYKILGINCLVSAFAMSIQFLDGVKYGDAQGTASGLLVAMLFMMLALSKPAPVLCAQRPHGSVFSLYAGASMAVQCTLKLALLTVAVELAKAHRTEAPPPDEDFAPNVVNTAAFLAGVACQLSTFAVNYVGRPFSTPLRANVPMVATLAVGWLVLGVCAANLAPDLGLQPMLELTPVPWSVGWFLLAGTVFDVAFSAAADAALLALLPCAQSQVVGALIS
jgi:cation-transporting ATPase 13A1